MRNRNLIKLAFLLLAGAAGQGLKAQVDPHFSQYYVYPAWLNPALTGAFDGDYRIAGIYRSQWGNITSPYSTPGVALDFTTNSNVNFGVSVLNQRAGDGGYNYTTAYANMAYTGVRFGANGNQRVTMGMQLGMIQRKFDRSKLTFGDQWNPITGYNPGVASADVFTRTSAASFDAGVGILYYDATPGKKSNFYGGISAAHLTKPQDKFSVGEDESLPLRYTFHAGLRIALSDGFSITPNALYLRQGTASEKMIGAYAQLKATDETDFMLGVNYRVKDAISPYVGFTYKELVLGVSYDVNTSELGKMSRGSNAFEISLSFTKRKKVRTPGAEFVCPRL
jgi:type IX secretion system PorP/SprF family membrane protein